MLVLYAWCALMISSIAAASIHGQNVTDTCSDAYKATLPRTVQVTEAMIRLVNTTESIPLFRVSGIAAARAALIAQATFSKLTQSMDKALSEDDRASLIQARTQETEVAIWLGLVEQNINLLSDVQKNALHDFNLEAKSERTAKQLADQACPELAASIPGERTP